MPTYNVSAYIAHIVEAPSYAEAEDRVRASVSKRLEDNSLSAYRDFVYSVSPGFDFDGEVNYSADDIYAGALEEE